MTTSSTHLSSSLPVTSAGNALQIVGAVPRVSDGSRTSLTFQRARGQDFSFEGLEVDPESNSLAAMEETVKLSISDTAITLTVDRTRPAPLERFSFVLSARSGSRRLESGKTAVLAGDREPPKDESGPSGTDSRRRARRIDPLASIRLLQSMRGDPDAGSKGLAHWPAMQVRVEFAS